MLGNMSKNAQIIQARTHAQVWVYPMWV